LNFLGGLKILVLDSEQALAKLNLIMGFITFKINNKNMEHIHFVHVPCDNSQYTLEQRRIEYEISRLEDVLKMSPCEGCRAKAASLVHRESDEMRCSCELCNSYEEFLKDPTQHRFYSECCECRNLIDKLRKIVRPGFFSDERDDNRRTVE